MVSNMPKKTLEINEKTGLMVLALPIFGEMLLNILVNNVDTLMLSHYSETGVGAVSNSNQVMFFMILMFNIIATSTSVVVAQYLGAKQYEKMNMIYSLAFIVNFIFGIVLSSLFVFSKYAIMELINVPEAMRPEAALYINIVGGSLFLQACYNVMLQILRCNGHAKVGFVISLFINGINIAGNYLFLYGPLSFLELGVGGVAISTAVARLVALVCAVGFFAVKRIGSINIKYIIPFPAKMLLEMIKIGLPSAGENLSYNMYQILLLSFVNGMGEDAVNAKAYSASLISFSMVFSNSAAMATQIITGHLVGAGKEDAAYKRVFQTLLVSMPITIALAAINWLISPYTLRIFTKNENIIMMGSFIMLVDIAIEIGRCLNMTFVSSLKAAGDYVFPLIVGIIMMWGFGATVGYAMGVAAGIGVAGVYMGTATDEVLRGIITMERWRRKSWLGKSLVKKEKDNKMKPIDV